MVEITEIITITWIPESRSLAIQFIENCVVPQPRQTSTSRYRKDGKGRQVQEYLDRQANLRDLLVLRLRQEGLEFPIFKKGVPLGFASSFRSPRAGRADLSNFEKSAEDLCQPVVYQNDIQIAVRGYGSKIKSNRESMLIMVWEIEAVPQLWP